MIPGDFRRLSLPPAGFIDANGPLCGKWEGDRIVIGLEIEARHCNSNGTCHGGMLTMVADMLLAMGSNLQAGLSRFLPTISLTCDFFGPAKQGVWVEGRLEVLKVTKTLVFSQGLLTVQGELILRANAILKLSTVTDPKYASDNFLPRA
jgi:uncharacterized protein (TIGR00369 family)